MISFHRKGFILVWILACGLGALILTGTMLETLRVHIKRAKIHQNQTALEHGTELMLQSGIEKLEKLWQEGPSATLSQISQEDGKTFRAYPTDDVPFELTSKAEKAHQMEWKGHQIKVPLTTVKHRNQVMECGYWIEDLSHRDPENQSQLAGLQFLRSRNHSSKYPWLLPDSEGWGNWQGVIKRLEERSTYLENKSIIAGVSSGAIWPLEVEWKWGLYSHGKPDRIEKPIRLRFFFKITLVNPYSYPLEFHGQERSMKVLLRIDNPGFVRIENRTFGRTSSWLDMSSISNPVNGEQGITAWLTLPSRLEPGETVLLVEPNPGDKPEGLARLAVAGFPVRNSDEIYTYWKPGAEPAKFHIMAFSSASGQSDPEEHEILYTYKPLNLRTISSHFVRADAAPRPFYIGYSSYNFRETHTTFSLRITPPAFWNKPVPYPNAEWRQDPMFTPNDPSFPNADAASTQPPLYVRQFNRKTIETDLKTGDLPPKLPLGMYWPDKESPIIPKLASHIGNLPWFRLGLPDSEPVNTIFNLAWSPQIPAQSIRLTRKNQKTKNSENTALAHPVNIHSQVPETWYSWLARSENLSPKNKKHSFSREDLKIISRYLASHTGKHPHVFRSISEFAESPLLDDSLRKLGISDLDALKIRQSWLLHGHQFLCSAGWVFRIVCLARLKDGPSRFMLNEAYLVIFPDARNGAKKPFSISVIPMVPQNENSSWFSSVTSLNRTPTPIKRTE